MLYILITTLVLLLLVELKLRKSFAAPSVLLLLSFLMASSLIFINQKNWDVLLSSRFVIYVLTAVLSFILASHVVHFIFQKNSSKVLSNLQSIEKILTKRISLMIIVTIAFIIYILLYIRRVGFNLNLTILLSNAYSTNVLSSGNSGGFFETQMLKIITAIAYVSWYQFLLSKFIVKSNALHLTKFYNIILFLITGILSTDRNILLRFFIYALVLWIMFFFDSNKDYMKNINFKIVRRLIVYVSVILLILYLAGKMKGYVSDFQRSIGIYGGSGLNNFNLFLNDFHGEQLQWGSVTFRSLNSLIETFLGTVSQGTTIFDLPIVFRSSTGFVYISNVYSAMKPFVMDFGYFGMIFLPMLLGIFFEILYSISMKHKFDFSWILYSTLIYPVIYFTISEQFFARLHLGSIYEIFWLAVLYWYIRMPIRFKLK